MAVADRPPQAGFDVHEGCRQPPLALAGVLPVVDLRAAFLDESTDGFKAVRRLEIQDILSYRARRSANMNQ